MTPFQIYGKNYANYSAENFQIKLMQLSNQLNLMYETDSVDTQVQILTNNFFISSRLLCSIRSEINKKATC